LRFIQILIDSKRIFLHHARMIILCGGTKGGIGKTTVATNLASIRASRVGAGKVALIDADPQESAYKFTRLRNESRGSAGFHCFKLTGKPVRSEVMGLADKYQDIIIDAGLGDSTGQRAAMTIANVLVLPFRPSSYDIWTVADLKHLIEEMQVLNPGMRVLAFINQADHVGHDNNEAAEMLREADYIEVLELTLGSRKAFRNTAAGVAVTELQPQDIKASGEMLALYKAVFSLRSNKNHPDSKMIHSKREAV
jgi:chromosome partitioning protein